LVLAGHSYGGRQSSMLAAEQQGAAHALLLLSYPLHPPRQPEKMRTDHFPSLSMPVVFVHGTRDPFGTVEELRMAIKAIPGRCQLHAVEKGAHNLPMSAAALLPGWLSAMMGK
jgi:predicted alpha/beta-hydrolase family hydrolase